MGPFRKTRSISERFPAERLSFLPALVATSIERCIRSSGFDSGAVWGSRFIGGYLLGYTNYLDDLDERFGGAVRKMMLDAILGPENGAEVFRAAMGHFLLEDGQTKRGWGAGAPDGERFFRALESGIDAEGSADSLSMMFEVGSVDPTQQLFD